VCKPIFSADDAQQPDAEDGSVWFLPSCQYYGPLLIWGVGQITRREGQHSDQPPDPVKLGLSGDAPIRERDFHQLHRPRPRGRRLGRPVGGMVPGVELRVFPRQGPQPWGEGW